MGAFSTGDSYISCPLSLDRKPTVTPSTVTFCGTILAENSTMPGVGTPMTPRERQDLIRSATTRVRSTDATSIAHLGGAACGTARTGAASLVCSAFTERSSGTTHLARMVRSACVTVIVVTTEVLTQPS